jgi:hypothetical protein
MASEAAFTVRNYTDAGNGSAIPALDDLFVFVAAGKVSLVHAKRSEGVIRSLRSVGSMGEGFTAPGRFNVALEELNVQTEFASLTVVVMNDLHAFVPEPLFVGEKAASYLRVTQQVPASAPVLFNRISQRNMVSVYAVNPVVHDTLRKHWPEAPFLHRNELFLALMQEQNDTDHPVFLHIRETSFDLGWLRNGSLAYFNTFPYEADTDIIYFVLSVMEDQKLEAGDARILVSGEVNANGPLPGLMKKYIPHSMFMKRPGSLRYPASFREFAEHQHMVEISCLLCE